ncbi:MAG: TlpA disulfide reductase family protein [Proteobacteria bacterium]|nr:TlpA disulfide reductase family protein [Pseudomonadota bacterium]
MLADRPLSPALCPNNQPCSLPVRAPDFTATDHNGKPVKLSSLRGKTVLLNFWGSWCGVCKTEKPALQAMAAEMGGDDFVVVALASDRSWTDVLLGLVDSLAPNAVRPQGKAVSMDDALKAYNAALPQGTAFKVWLDPPSDGSIGSVTQQWGVTAVPDSVLIDRNGIIQAYFVNKRDWTSSVAETCLRSVIDKE